MSAGGTAGAPGRPYLRIVRGDPTPEEVAALVAVLSAAAAASSAVVEPESPHEQGASQWGSPSRVMRTPISPTGWWASALPR